MVGYGGLLTWIFKKFGVPLDGLHFHMSPNNKIGAKCLNNLHLKLNDNGILEDTNEQVSVVDSDKEEEAQKNEEEREENEEEVLEKEDQEPVPSATVERAKDCSKREQGEEASKGEAEEQGEDVEEDIDDNDDSDEEVQLQGQKQPVATPRKSRRLASKRKSPTVDLDDDSTSHNTFEPTNDAPPSPKPATPPSHQIPSPPPSPIPFTPPPVTTHTSPNHGFASTSVPTALLYSILLKLNDL